MDCDSETDAVAEKMGKHSGAQQIETHTQSEGADSSPRREGQGENGGNPERAVCKGGAGNSCTLVREKDESSREIRKRL